MSPAQGGRLPVIDLSGAVLSVSIRSEDQKPSLDTLIALVEDEIRQVNQVIIENMQSDVTLIPQLASHIVAAGGKRLRPMLTLAGARLCGYGGGTRHIGLAACVEFIHTATLLHDDVVDNSDLRRGRESANAVWGNKPSVLVGDFLFSRAFVLMVGDGSLKVLDILSRTSAIIAEGEVMQLQTANNTDTDRDAYLNVVTAKTAALFAAAARIGAVVADRPEAEEQALHRYGADLGIAFQVIDDVLDYSARQATLGKTIGDDFRDGKVTLPVILAYGAGDESEQAFWRRCLEDQDIHDGDLDHALALLSKHDALAHSMDQARRYGATAIAALDIFPASAYKSALTDAVRFCIERPY